MNLTLSVLGAVFCAFAMEWASRLLNLEAGFFLQPSAGNCLQRDPLIGHSFRSNCVGTLSDTSLRTNSLGFRGDDSYEGRKRILAIGDSCTWGWKVGQAEAYPSVMQQRLDDGMQESSYGVMNAGIPGHTSYQGLLLLRERGLPLHPDVVVAGYGFNDQSLTGDVERQLAMEKTLLPLLRFDDYMLSVSHLWRWARWRGELRAQRTREPRVRCAAYRRNMADIVATAREHGARVLLLSFFGEFATNEYKDALFALAREQKVPLLQYKGPHLDLVHPTSEGYEDLADQILVRLAYEGYIR